MEENKNITGVMLVVLTILFLLCIASWVKECSLHNYLSISSVLVDRLAKNSMVVRFLFVVLFGAFVYLMPAKVKIKDDTVKYILAICSACLGLMIIIGCIGLGFYDLFIYPIIFVAYIINTVFAISCFTKRFFVTSGLFGISHEQSDFNFVFGTDQGELVIHKPEQNIMIDSGPGGGKSDTFIKPIIEQCCKKNYAGFVYDWEGDPKKKGSPILSQVAYACIQNEKKNGCTLNFAFINFTDMTRTVRVNIFSECYMPKGNESLFIRNIMVTLMKNLETSWRQKTDFWANNAINFVYSVAYKCYKERDSGINTLAHVIAICLQDVDSIFNWLSEDDEIKMNMMSMISAWKAGANQQTAGAVSSAQTPLTMLNNKNIFWVFSPSVEDEFDLDITNIKNPTLLCVGNSPSIKEAISPAISCITSVVMSTMNNPGKQKSIFLVDELPTIVLQGIEVFSSTARKHGVATILAIQDFGQAERDYGKESARILRSNCGNQFYGQSGNNDTARMMQDFFGEIDQISESFTTQNTGGGSETESLKKEKVMASRDIAGQKTGHFVGKIANGKPPFFSAQFDYNTMASQEIPPFSILINAGDDEKNDELMNVIVTKNYERIINQVKDLLEPYKQSS